MICITVKYIIKQYILIDNHMMLIYMFNNHRIDGSNIRKNIFNKKCSSYENYWSLSYDKDHNEINYKTL